MVVVVKRRINTIRDYVLRVLVGRAALRVLSRSAVVALLYFVVLGCSDEVPPTEVQEARDSTVERVRIYSSLKDSQLAAIQEGFAKKHPSIEMSYYSAGTGNVITRMATEQQAGGIEADLVWLGDPTHYERFKSQGLLRRYDSSSADQIPEEFKDSERYYVAARLIMIGFVYNTRLLDKDEVPRAWEDLLAPRFAGQVVMADPVSSGTTAFTIGALAGHEDYGWPYLRGLKGNGISVERAATGVVERVAAGDALVGIGVDYITREAAADGAPVGFVAPDYDIPLIESPLAIVAGARNAEAARTLYDYIISEAGQRMLVKEYSMPIHPGVSGGDGWIEVSDARDRMLRADHDRLMENRPRLLTRFDELIAQ